MCRGCVRVRGTSTTMGGARSWVKVQRAMSKCSSSARPSDKPGTNGNIHVHGSISSGTDWVWGMWLGTV